MAMTPGAGRRDRVYLTGFMGSGKSTVGPILANTIGYRFVDVDRAIEAVQGMTVSEVFRLQGEQFFRLQEREVIGHVSKEQKVVVALGGGALIDPRNLETVTTTGILVFLRLPREVLLKRLQRGKDRPLLANAEGVHLSEEDLSKRIASLYGAREPLYAKAEVIVDADEHRVGVTVDRIARSLAPLLR